MADLGSLNGSPEINLRDQTPPRKLRAACDPCHYGKLRCSGGKPCSNCRLSSKRCEYAFTNRIGRPKGAKNRKDQVDDQTQSRNIITLNSTGRNNHSHSNAYDHNQNHQQSDIHGHRNELVQSEEYDLNGDPALGSNRAAGRKGKEGLIVESTQGENTILGVCTREYSMMNDLDNSLGTGLFVPDSSPHHQQSRPHERINQSDLLGDIYGIPGIDLGFGGEELSSTSGAEMRQHPLLETPGINTDPFPGCKIYRSPPESIVEFSLSGNNSGRSSAQGYSYDSSVTLASTPLGSCNCLQSFVELVNRVRNVRERQQGSRLDVQMIIAEETLEALDRLLQCPTCHDDTTGATLILAAVALRSTLQLLRNESGTSPPGDNSQFSITPRVSPRLGTFNFSQNFSQAWNQGSVERVEMPITIGEYRMKGQGRHMVANSITSHAMELMDATVSTLKERCARLIALSGKRKEVAGRGEAQQRMDKEGTVFQGLEINKKYGQETINRLDEVLSRLIKEL